MRIGSKNRLPTDSKVGVPLSPGRRRVPGSLTALVVTVGLVPAACGGSGTKTVTAEQPTAPKANTTLTMHKGPPRVETAEYPADEFKNESMAAVIGRTAVDRTYEITCRILPNPGQPGSVADGGWYVLQQGGVVAANTFDNPPLSANHPYDTAVPACP